MKSRNNTSRSGNNFLKVFIHLGLDFYWVYCNNGIIQTTRHRLEDEDEETIFEKVVFFDSLPIEVQNKATLEINAYYNI